MTTHEAKPASGAPLRNEWKVVLVLAISLLFLEASIRPFAGFISTDLRNTLSTPTTAQQLSAATENTRTILVVGNSLARHGVDLEMLSQASHWTENADKSQVTTVLFAPDGSSVVKWGWGLKRYFANTGAHPDIILLVTGRTHLLDRPTSPESLGAYFIDQRDLGAAMDTMPNQEHALRLLLGRASHLFANRDRVRTRIGYSYLPGFESAWPALAAGNTSNLADQASGSHSHPVNLEALRRLITTAKQMGSELHVVSIPMPEAYQLPKPVLHLLAESDVPYHKLSENADIETTHFPDGYHLDTEGSKLFTQSLLRALRGNSSPLPNP